MQTYDYTTINDAASGSTTADAINLDGTIIGTGRNSNDFVSTGFLYDGGTVTPIIPPGAVSSYASGINLEGAIVGDYNTHGITLTTASIPPSIYGFIDDHGAYTEIAPPGGHVLGNAIINDRGELLGSYFTNVPIMGFIYDHGTYTTLAAPDAINPGRNQYGDNGPE